MVTREQALIVLNKFRENKPARFFNKVDETSAGMSFVLVYLNEHEGDVYASSIAEEMKISRARVAVLIQKLINKQMIEKLPSNSDARIEVLKLTSEGKEKIEFFKEQMISRVIKIIEEVGLEEVYKFIETSAKIRNILDETE